MMHGQKNIKLSVIFSNL